MTSSRPYRSQLREQQAEHTREVIAVAARARFLESGWAGTSIRSVAERAGVSEATVYSVYGNKAGLAHSLIDAAERSANVQQAIAELQERVGDPAAQLLAFVAFDRRLFEHGGDVLRTVAEARRHDPDLRSAYEEGRRRGDSERRTVFATWPQKVWRPGVDAERAVAIFGTLVCLDSFNTAMSDYAWSPDDVEQWWHTTLCELLLK